MRPCQNPVQIFGSPPLSPRLIKKEKRIALMSRFSFGLLNISTRCEGFFWTSLHFTQWHYRISSKYPFFQYLWEAVFSADAALSPLSLLASSWFSRSQTKMSAKSSSLSGLWQKTPLSDRLDGPVHPVLVGHSLGCSGKRPFLKGHRFL